MHHAGVVYVGNMQKERYAALDCIRVTFPNQYNTALGSCRIKLVPNAVVR